MTSILPQPAPSVDDDLMRRAAADEEAALAEIMARWQAPLHRFILRGVRDEGLAEELTQETFWLIWRARGRYQPDGRFSAWLYRIAGRLCLDHHRRRARRPLLLLTPPDQSPAAERAAPPADDADAAAREAELASRLDRALAALPLRQRLAFEMNRLDDMSYREIAETLGCSRGSVEQLIFRARRTLHEALREEPPATLIVSRKKAPPPCVSPLGHKRWNE